VLKINKDRSIKK